MNKNTYHFEHLRLHISPQTRVNSWTDNPGFSSLRDCVEFCTSIGFSFKVVFYNHNGDKSIISESSYKSLIR